MLSANLLASERRPRPTVRLHASGSRRRRRRTRSTATGSRTALVTFTNRRDNLFTGLPFLALRHGGASSTLVAVTCAYRQHLFLVEFSVKISVEMVGLVS